MKPTPSLTGRLCLLLATSVFVSTTFLTSCGSGESKNEDSTAVAAAPVQDTPFDTLISFCNWTELGLRATPSEKGKYVTTVYLGEGLTLKGDTASEISGGKRIHFHKVMLIDGKEGWLRDEFIAMDAVPAVFTNQSSVYLRPDESTVSDKTFAQLDVVAVKAPKGNFVEANGKPSGKSWFQQGNVHISDLSFNKTDINLAVLYRRAVETKDLQQQQTRLENIRNNATFQSSSLYAMIFPPDNEVYGEESDPGVEYKMYNFSGTVGDLGYEGVRFIADGDGVENAALYFDGKAHLNREFGDEMDVTFCFWLKADKVQPGAVPFIVGNGCTSGYAFNLEDDGNGGMRLAVLCGGVQTNITDSPYSLPVNKWVHLCMVKHETEFTVYVDGELSSSGTSGYHNPEEGLTIGAAPGCNPPGIGGHFSGSIDDFFYILDVLDAQGVQRVKSGAYK